MPLFKNKQLNFIGVDLSSDAIKVVELTENQGKPQLVTYGYTETKPDVLRGDLIENKNITSTVLKEVLERAQVSSKNAVAALPISAVFNTVVKISSVSKKELSDRALMKQRVGEHVKHILPQAIDEMLFDFNILSSNTQESEPDGVKVLVTASSKDIVQKYVEVFKQAGLELNNLDIEPFALVRSLIGNDKSRILLADIGENMTGLSLVESGIPVINRAITVGGSAVTRTLSEQMSISMEEAEQYKRDLGIMIEQSENKELPRPVLSAIGPIIAEMKYVVKMYHQQMGNNNAIDKIILTGGSANLAGFSEHITRELGVNTYLGDPWARIIYPQELRPVLNDIGPRFSVAIGLAMRDIVE